MPLPPANLVERLLGEITKRRKRIVIIGDVMVDRWVHGHVAQCQDNCPKFVQESVVETPGGAANAQACLSNWGVNTSLYGYAQNDCPVKTRYVDGGEIVFRADDDGPPTRGGGYEWARILALEFAYHAGAVLLSDYDKGILTLPFIREVSDLCKRRGIPCVADVKREPRVYAGCIIKCNADYQHKWNDGLGNIVFTDKGISSEKLVVTTGGLNPIVWGGNAAPSGLGYDLPVVRCINHVGAGDCFAAHLALSLAYGFSLKEAAAVAHSAGRVYVQYPHNRPPTPAEIAADMASATLIAT